MNSGNKSGKKRQKKEKATNSFQGFFSLSLWLARSLFWVRGAGNFSGQRHTARLLLRKGRNKEGKERKTKQRGETFPSKKKEAPACLVSSSLSPSTPSPLSLSPSSSSLSHRALARPLPRRLLVPRPVRLVDVRDLGNERVVRVRVAEQRADREEHFREREGRRPLLLEDVEADRALRVDVGVVDLVVLVGFFYSERGREGGR